MTMFDSKAPWIMALLMRDFPLALDDAAAILGNLGHESGGLAQLQELKPVVAGSRGGYGWPQWTGSRRRAYEAYCRRNGLDPASDKANYGYLFVELTGPEKKAIAAVTAARGLEAKVRAFELAFERAGVKHYASRNRWAARALKAWHAAGGAPVLPDWAGPAATVPAPAPTPRPQPDDPGVAPGQTPAEPLSRSKRFWTWLTTGGGTAVLPFVDWRVQALIVVVVVGFAIYAIATMPALRRKLGLA